MSLDSPGSIPYKLCLLVQSIYNCMVASICENKRICLVRISLKAIVTIKMCLDLPKSSIIENYTDFKMKLDIIIKI